MAPRSAPPARPRARRRCSVEIAEVWEASDDLLCVRQDGGWRSHQIAAVWRPAALRAQRLALADKQTATGRVPDAVHRLRAAPSGRVAAPFRVEQ